MAGVADLSDQFAYPPVAFLNSANKLLSEASDLLGERCQVSIAARRLPGRSWRCGAFVPPGLGVECTQVRLHERRFHLTLMFIRGAYRASPP
jgi:hypothetical protein